MLAEAVVVLVSQELKAVLVEMVVAVKVATALLLALLEHLILVVVEVVVVTKEQVVRLQQVEEPVALAL